MSSKYTGEGKNSHIPIAKAAEALSYADQGYKRYKIAQLCDLSTTSVQRILQGHGRWETLLPKDRIELERIRQEQNLTLEQAWRAGAAQAIAHAFTPEKMEKASFLQLTTGACQALDKALLLSGHATQIVSHVADRRAVESIEALASALSEALMSRETQAIEVNSQEVTD